ncbi:DinB family protein [Adhaeribacter sp. BT258]|uniref:DinB family protein n=1 Tax=Adhaeribacter terrigena TaxID=2793070 RepID=A0ABS1BXG3_9BACT|nr:DinB family protein [Adhaeribacter terrigena]MBK0401784.1 DinB family protein [Adhaeribacter terrigena]
MNPTLDQLTREVRTIVQFAETELKKLPIEKLNQRPANGGWSLLECLEHLNRYSNYYNPALEKALATNSSAKGNSEITLTWIGKKSVEMIAPNNTKKHKTMKKMNPQGSLLHASVVDEFLKNQQQLLSLLQKSGQTDLGKKAVPVEFFRLLKMNIGETLLFMVLHEQRHFLQLQRILAEVTTRRNAAA